MYVYSTRGTLPLPEWRMVSTGAMISTGVPHPGGCPSDLSRGGSDRQDAAGQMAQMDDRKDVGEMAPMEGPAAGLGGEGGGGSSGGFSHSWGRCTPPQYIYIYVCIYIYLYIYIYVHI